MSQSYVLKECKATKNELRIKVYSGEEGVLELIKVIEELKKKMGNRIKGEK